MVIEEDLLRLRLRGLPGGGGLSSEDGGDAFTTGS